MPGRPDGIPFQRTILGLHPSRSGRRAWHAVVLALWIAGCAPSGPPPTLPHPAAPIEAKLGLLYPTAESAVEMGREVKLILTAEADGTGLPPGSRLTALLRNPAGRLSAVLPAEIGPGDVFRTQGWPIPHRSMPGMWTVEAKVEGSPNRAVPLGQFEVRESKSETLLGRYGVWIDPPSFGGIATDVFAERGDSEDGMFRIGGARPAQHVFPEEWIEIHWRRGDYRLDDGAAARRFMLEAIGDFGFSPTRELGEFHEFAFKGWSAWRAAARGELSHSQNEWVVFYAPEMDRTYAIGTTVVLPPAGGDPHVLLRASFEVHPEVHPSFASAQALARLRPGPELISPPMGSIFRGGEEPVVLRWSSVTDLTDDEYYQVEVDYDYREASFALKFTTRSTEVSLPATLYQTPNCHVFNWQVTLMEQTGTTPGGAPTGIPRSFPSFYAYIEWTYPLAEAQPFPPLCPNPQT